ncbi:hypothetical protein JXA56_00340 [Candidatus Micrarchaeota archaeon]|nr:hypothetical protein [Candidatus Micrarchaeota archaeon]
MQKDQSEFSETIKEIRLAEEEYDSVISRAKSEAQKIAVEAKEMALRERKKNSDEIVKYKNEKLKEGSSGIEKEVEKILKKAKDEGAKIRKNKADSKEVSAIVREFLNSI